MKTWPKKMEPAGRERSSGPFLQPLAVGLVCLVLVTLGLVTGLMDLRTLDKTLVGYMEKNALELIRNIQQVAKHNLGLLDHGSERDLGGGTAADFSEEPFSLQEAMILDLMALGHRIDFERERSLLDDDGLRSTASREAVWLLVLFNDRGDITFRNRPVTEALFRLVEPVVTGKAGVRINLFARTGKSDPMKALVLRRKWGKGAIALVLDDEGFLFWKLRVSVERAVEDVGMGADTGYFLVTNKAGKTLFRSGEGAMTPQMAAGIHDIPKNGDGVTSKKIVWEGQKHLEVVAPIYFGGAISGMAHLSLSRETADQMLTKERNRGFASMGFMVLMAILSMGFLYRNQNRHLAKVREMEKRLTRAERLSAMGRLAAGVAHEIRNPLNAISMACQRLQEDNLPQLTRVIRDEIRRLNHIIEEFIGFSRSRKLTLKRHDIIDLLRQIALLVGEEAESRGITIQTDWGESPLMLRIDLDKMKQAFLNIVKNAMESISNRGRVTLSAAPAGHGWVMVSIRDTGSGLTREEMEKVFDPDYTTKEKGLGLGLALAHEIVQGHSGEIRVMSESGKGATFEILLPANPVGS